MRLAKMAVAAWLLAAVCWAGPPAARADGSWTLLPQQEWEDEFSPLYIDEDGVLCEGDPTTPDEPATAEALIQRNVWDPINEVYIPIQSIENEVLVNFTASTPPVTIEELFDDVDVSIVAAWYEPDPSDAETSMSWFHVRINGSSQYFLDVPGLIAYLSGLSSVEFAEYNDLVQPSDFPQDDPDDTYYSDQVEIPLLNADDAWETTTGGDTDIGVVIVDSGVDVNHEDLDDKVFRHPTSNKRLGIAALKDKTFYGNVDKKQQLRNLQTGKGGHGHGTCVAGIVGAETNNSQGVAGCGPDVSILSARLYMPYANSFTIDSIVRAIKKVRKKLNSGNGIDYVRVVNMSLGTSAASQSFAKAILKDRKHNDRLYVAAAGNGGNNGLTYPGAWSYVLGVTGAKDNSGTDERHPNTTYYYSGSLNLAVYGISAYFTWGKTTDVTGSDGYGSGNYLDDFNGTSAATPQISALAGLLYSIDPDNTTEDAVSDHIKRYTKGSDHNTISFTVGGNTKYIPAVSDFDRAVDNW